MQYYYFFKQQYAADDPAQDLAVLNTAARGMEGHGRKPL